MVVGGHFQGLIAIPHRDVSVAWQRAGAGPSEIYDLGSELGVYLCIYKPNTVI